MKKMLALLLAALLAAALCAPAMAFLSWDNIIVTAPETAVPYGEAFTLHAAVVDLPARIEVVSYQWLHVSGGSRTPIDGATEPILQVAPEDDCYPEASVPYLEAEETYVCNVFLLEQDEYGLIGTFTLPSRETRVTVTPERKMNFFEIVMKSAEAGFGLVSLSCNVSAYLLLPLAPITYLIGFCIGYIKLTLAR